MVSVVTLAVSAPSAPPHGVTALDAVHVGQVDIGEADRARVGQVADRRDQLGAPRRHVGRRHHRRIVGAGDRDVIVRAHRAALAVVAA